MTGYQAEFNIRASQGAIVDTQGIRFHKCGLVEAFNGNMGPDVNAALSNEISSNHSFDPSGPGGMV